MADAEGTTSRVTVDVDADDGRFHRQALISWWEQERLASACVLVVGAGALGNELVKNLALLGVGTVVVVDMDEIENSNLSRCVFFRESDEGEPKAPVVCRGAAEINPAARFVPVVGDVRHSVGLASFADFDVVLGGLDSREARLHVNQACWKAGTPWVDGAIEGLTGVVRVFVPPDSSCYECTMSARDHEIIATRKTCALLSREQMLAGKVPTTATSASLIAAMQVQEAVKLLHADRVPPTFAGRGFFLNGMTHDSYAIEYPRREACMSHDTYDLADASAVARSMPLGDLVRRASDTLGGAAVITLEHDVVVALGCARCATTERPLVLLTRASEALARCPGCDDERSIDLRHSTEGVDDPLYGATADDLGLPPGDVITGQTLQARVHYVLDDRPTWTGGPLAEASAVRMS